LNILSWFMYKKTTKKKGKRLGVNLTQKKD
jgi:hypothetical protein